MQNALKKVFLYNGADTELSFSLLTDVADAKVALPTAVMTASYQVVDQLVVLLAGHARPPPAQAR
jgi:hypothetical protein